MKTNLAQLEQAEMDKSMWTWRQPGWHLRALQYASCRGGGRT